MSVAKAEALVPEHRRSIHRIHSQQGVIEVAPNMTLRAGHVIALCGPRQVIVEMIGPRAEELDDRELVDIPVTSADVRWINPDLAEPDSELFQRG
jgi:putative transport protein